jgi:hypothetical protein
MNKIHIKAKNKGKLHRFLGVPQGEKLTNHQLNMAAGSPSPAVRKMANFAKNARKWNHG